MTNKYLVTWANGFVWSKLVEKLVEEWKEVVAVDLKFDNIKEELLDKIKTKVCNILDIAKLEEITKKEWITHIYHLAAKVTYDQSEERSMYDTNVNWTRNIMHLAKKYKDQIVRVLNVSSTSVMWTQHISLLRNDEPWRISEDTGYIDSHISDFSYPITKYTAEELAKREAKLNWIDLVTIRPSTVVWGWDVSMSSQWWAVEYVDKQKIPLSLPGKLTVVEVSDLVEGMILAMDKWKNWEEYILTDIDTTILDIAKLIRKELWKFPYVLKIPYFLFRLIESPLVFLEKISKNKHKIRLLRDLLWICTRSRLFDWSKAKNKLWWTPKWNLKDAIKDAVKYYKSQKQV